MQYCTYQLYACAGLSIADISPILIFVISLITKAYKYRTQNYQMKKQQNNKLKQSKSYKANQISLFIFLLLNFVSGVLCLAFTIEADEDQWINQIAFMIGITYWFLMIIILYKEQKHIGGVSKYILWNWYWNLFWFVSSSIYIHLSQDDIQLNILICRVAYVLFSMGIIYCATVLRRKKKLARRLIKKQQEDQLIQDINYFKQQKQLKQNQQNSDITEPLIEQVQDNQFNSQTKSISSYGKTSQSSNKTSIKTEKTLILSENAERKVSMNQSEDIDNLSQLTFIGEEDLKPINRDITDITILGWDQIKRFNKLTVVFVIQYVYKGKTKQTKRSLREFQSLHDNLKNAYPSEVLPSFPEKSESENLDRNFLKQRKKKLQQILEFISIRNLIDDFVISFLEDDQKTNTNKNNQNKQRVTMHDEPIKIIEEASSIESNIQKHNFSLTNSDL